MWLFVYVRPYYPGAEEHPTEAAALEAMRAWLEENAAQDGHNAATCYVVRVAHRAECKTYY